MIAKDDIFAEIIILPSLFGTIMIVAHFLFDKIDSIFFLKYLIEMVSVALFLPNIIGYIRAITGIISFLFVDTNPK